MPSLAYYEEDLFGFDDVTDDDIRKSSDIDELQEWLASAEAVVEDIKGQIEANALGNNAAPDWVYRAGKAVGFQRRAASRIRSRLGALGWTPPFRQNELAELHRKVAEWKARNEVAVEFLRLCEEGALKNPELFQRIEAEAIRLVGERRQKRKPELVTEARS